MLHSLFNNKEIVEIQVDHKNNVESSYRVDYLSIYQILSIKEIFSLAFNLSDIELVSIHNKDDIINYSEIITISYKGQVPNILRSIFALDLNYKFADYYVLKFDLVNKKFYLKTYDFNFYKYIIPQLPVNSYLANQFGVSSYHGKEELKDTHDVYFFNSRTDTVQSFYKLGSAEMHTPTSHLALYGISYNLGPKSLKILKLKRYFYPNDLNILSPGKL